VTDHLKRVRQGVKRPLQSVYAAAMVLPLDRRTRSLRDLDALQPRRIVVSRTDRIGDLLCCTPLLVALHRRWPDARIVLVAGAKNRAVIAGLPFLEEGPVFRRDPASWTRLAWWLGRRRFELSVSLRAESMAGVWISGWSGAPVRMATHRTYAAPSCNLILGADEFHQLRRYSHAAAMLGFPPAEPRPIFTVAAEAEGRAAELAAGLLPPDARPVVGFQIPHRTSRRHAVRAWAPEKVIELVRHLAADGCRVVLCGTGEERTEAARVAALVPGAVVGPAVPLAVFAALQRRFDVFIAQYTGTLHLADAMGVATVAYGLPLQEEGWGVIGSRGRSITGPVVAEIPVEPLLDAARALLAEGARRPGKGRSA
jgi:ADP-heptose:LPS heptosyltransferase